MDGQDEFFDTSVVGTSSSSNVATRSGGGSTRASAIRSTAQNMADRPTMESSPVSQAPVVRFVAQDEDDEEEAEVELGTQRDLKPDVGRLQQLFQIINDQGNN